MRILKKYPNRRIYDTETSKFVTLADVRKMIVKRDAIQVIHSKTGKDLTRSVLLQIISEMEEEGHPSLLTNRVLNELIRFYGNPMVGMMAPFLEQQILQYLTVQDKLREQFLSAVSKPYPSPEKAIRQLVEKYKAFMQQAASGKADDVEPQ